MIRFHGSKVSVKRAAKEIVKQFVVIVNDEWFDCDDEVDRDAMTYDEQNKIEREIGKQVDRIRRLIK